MLRTGIDLIEVERVDHLIITHGRRFLERVYTEQELIDSNGRTPSLAVRMAAKEAVSKALGCGIGIVSWKDIEIVRNQQQLPLLNLSGHALILAEELGPDEWSVSLTHSHDHAAAIVIATVA
jgi:holo-[acyl-carrier protein] synthase